MERFVIWNTNHPKAGKQLTNIYEVIEFEQSAGEVITSTIDTQDIQAVGLALSKSFGCEMQYELESVHDSLKTT